MGQLRIRWPDGLEQAAPTWDDMLQKVNDLPWNRNLDEFEMRHALAKRAYVWSLREIDPTLPAEALFRELEEARMLQIVPVDSSGDCR